jgi:hemolysin-activating ACP:hemolysin acyltransferase
MLSRDLKGYAIRVDAYSRPIGFASWSQLDNSFPTFR